MTQPRLAPAYLAIRDEAPQPDEAALERRLEDALRRARAVHPTLAVDDVAFVEFLATRVTIDSCDAHLADLYLACAVATSAPGAAARLESQCISQVAKAIVRIDGSMRFVAEIEQRVREKLIVGTEDRPGRIAEYAARGPLAAFVRVAAIREALMEKRACADELDEPYGFVDGDSRAGELSRIAARE